MPMPKAAPKSRIFGRSKSKGSFKTDAVRPAPKGEVVIVEVVLKRKNGTLGIAIQDDTCITEVDKGSGGDDAGLKPGDFIVEVNGSTVDSYAELLPLLKILPAAGFPAFVRREVQITDAAPVGVTPALEPAPAPAPAPEKVKNSLAHRTAS